MLLPIIWAIECFTTPRCAHPQRAHWRVPRREYSCLFDTAKPGLLQRAKRVPAIEGARPRPRAGSAYYQL